MMIKKSVLAASAAIFFAFACSDSEVIPVGESNIRDTQISLQPIAHLSFTQPPSAHDIQMALANNDQDSSFLVPGESPYPLYNTQKLVVLTVKTADYKKAGTDNPLHAVFHGKWLTDTGKSSLVNFILDYPKQRDLDRNMIDVFFYKMNVGYASDRFMSGRLSNTARDKWLCEYVEVRDESCNGIRNWRLSWGDIQTDWISSLGNSTTRELTADTPTSIYYNNCP